MLVVLSDVHLTDGTCGTIIDPKVFRKFSDLLLGIIGDPKKTNINKVHLVFLGDIFDVIRSDYWLRPENHPSKKPIRPWSPAGDRDKEGTNLQDYTEAIIDRILATKQNIAIKNYLKDFRTKCPPEVEQEISYLIGNHDWLINRYPSTRQKIAEFLGMHNPEFYKTNCFCEYRTFPEYGVTARHGDCFDKLNFSGNRDASSIGDAQVIDLLNHFPKEVEGQMNLTRHDELAKQLREIDNVRPYLDIPAYIEGVCRHYAPDVANQVHSIWNKLVDEYLHLQYVQDLARSNWGLWFLQRFVLRLTTGLSWGRLMRILSREIIRRRYQRLDDYKAFAYKEIQDTGVSYAVYGHTHSAQQTPLTVVSKDKEQVYFNSGTWRKVFEHTAFRRKDCDFIGWYVLNFVIFYLPKEKELERKYEFWAASLGAERKIKE